MIGHQKMPQPPEGGYGIFLREREFFMKNTGKSVVKLVYAAVCLALAMVLPLLILEEEIESAHSISSEELI